MKSFISSLDILSYHPAVYFNGKTYYQTVLGGIITILTFTTIITISIIFLIDFINGSNKTVIFSREANFDSVFKMDQTLFGFLLYTTNTNEIVPESILSITGLTIFEDRPGNFTYTPFKPKQCTENNIPNLNYLNLDKNYFTSFLCLNTTDNYQIGGDRKNYFNLYIHKCNNETYNNKCKSMEEIDKYINSNNLFLIFNYQYVVVDHSNKNNPISISTKVREISIPSGFSLATKTYFRKTIYENDDNLIFRSKNKKEGISLDFSTTSYLYTAQISNNLIPNSISVFMFESANDYTEKYTRSYEKLGVLFGNIGGIINIIFYFLSFITGLLTKGFYFNDLIFLSSFNKGNKLDNIDNIDNINNINNINNLECIPYINKNDNSYSKMIINRPKIDYKRYETVNNYFSKSNIIKTHKKNSFNIDKYNNTNYDINKSLNLKNNIKDLIYKENQLKSIGLQYILFYTCCWIKNKKYKNLRIFNSFVKDIQEKLSCNNIISRVNLLYQLYSNIFNKNIIYSIK